MQFQQAFQAVQSHHGDLNALTPFGSLLVDAGAPGTIQTVLTPGNYVALNVTGNGPSAIRAVHGHAVVLAGVTAGGRGDRDLDRVRLQGPQRPA